MISSDAIIWLIPSDDISLWWMQHGTRLLCRLFWWNVRGLEGKKRTGRKGRAHGKCGCGRLNALARVSVQGVGTEGGFCSGSLVLGTLTQEEKPRWRNSSRARGQTQGLGRLVWARVRLLGTLLLLLLLLLNCRGRRLLRSRRGDRSAGRNGPTGAGLP